MWRCHRTVFSSQSFWRIIHHPSTSCWVGIAPPLVSMANAAGKRHAALEPGQGNLMARLFFFVRTRRGNSPAKPPSACQQELNFERGVGLITFFDQLLAGARREASKWPKQAWIINPFSGTMHSFSPWCHPDICWIRFSLQFPEKRAC